MNDADRFASACSAVLSTAHEKEGIGTEGEKTLHAVFKTYYEPDPAFHEVRTGRFIADIRREGEIVEIQTAGLYRMKKKLAAFLPDYRVTVVHPIPRVRTVRWIERDGSFSDKRKSPKTGKYLDAVSELLGVRDLLAHPNLSVVLSLVDCNDYKVRSGKIGRKRGAMRFERIPTALVSELRLSTPRDYLTFLPADLPDVFTSADVVRLGKMHRDDATALLLLLFTLGAVERLGKDEKRYYLYRLVP